MSSTILDVDKELVLKSVSVSTTLLQSTELPEEFSIVSQTDSDNAAVPVADYGVNRHFENHSKGFVMFLR